LPEPALARHDQQLPGRLPGNPTAGGVTIDWDELQVVPELALPVPSPVNVAADASRIDIEVTLTKWENEIGVGILIAHGSESLERLVAPKGTDVLPLIDIGPVQLPTDESVTDTKVPPLNSPKFNDAKSMIACCRPCIPLAPGVVASSDMQVMVAVAWS
jgi:hypothetical protein